MWFADPQDAGRQLAQRLLRLKEHHPLVLALPPGGVPVGLEVAAILQAPIDLVLAEPIAVPDAPDLIIGAVAAGTEPVLTLDSGLVRRLDLPMTHVANAAEAAALELERRREVYVADRPPSDVSGRVVIVVTDGVCLGTLARAALQATRKRQPARLILAVPVARADAIGPVRQDADEVVCLGVVEEFMGVGQFYRQYPRLSDAELAALLRLPPAVAARDHSEMQP